MKKVMMICWKDLRILLHDRAAWVLMLAAPFILTLGLGAVTGAFSGGSTSGLQEVPLVVVNQDQGELGTVLVDALTSESLDGLFTVQAGADVMAARSLVEKDQVAAAIFIPEQFSDSLVSKDASGQASGTPVEIYTSPARPISASVIQSVVTEILGQIEVNPIAAQVTIEQLIASGRLPGNQVASYVSQMNKQGGPSASAVPSITVDLDKGTSEQPSQAAMMAYLAPAMAVVFLMYTVTQGGRSILAERDFGTLPRMLSTPTRMVEVLGGKIASIFITGLIQLGVLILVSGLIFGLQWGDPLALIVLILAVVAASTGWGILLASVATTPFQVSSIGTAIMLFFGILGGSFIPTANFSPSMQLLSRVTPNAWALDGFSMLSSGGTIDSILSPLLALAAMTLVLFVVSVLVARRRWATGFLKA